MKNRLRIFTKKNPKETNCIILSKTETIKFNDNKTNKNTFVIGGAGSGKTRFFVTPNLMQMNSSYVVSDSSGLILSNIGKLLIEKGNYKIKIFDMCNCKKSMHYNPFSYIHSEKDILNLVDIIIANTKGDGEKSGEDFWVKAERFLYTAYIGYIFFESPKEEQNFNTLIEMINASKACEDDEEFKNSIDILFERLERKEPDHFAVIQYKKYKLAAGKDVKSILISCAARLTVFQDKELQELMSYDELELDALGGRDKDDKQKTALFIIFPISCCDRELITAMLYTQLFSVLNDRASDVFGGGLPIPVHFILDEFRHIGTIPNFDKTIVTLKGRNIWVSIIIQSIQEIKIKYGKYYEEIIRYCDNMLYLGTMNNETQEFIRKYLDIKNQTDLRTGAVCLVARNKVYCFSSQYDITKHKFYRHLADYEKGRRKNENE